MASAEDPFTIQVVVLLAVRVSEGVELLQQQRVLQDPLDGLDQVRLQGGRVLLSGVPLGQEGLEIRVGFSWNEEKHLSGPQDRKVDTDSGTSAAQRPEELPSDESAAGLSPALPFARTFGTFVWLAQKAL